MDREAIEKEIKADLLAKMPDMLYCTKRYNMLPCEASDMRNDIINMLGLQADESGHELDIEPTPEPVVEPTKGKSLTELWT